MATRNFFKPKNYRDFIQKVTNPIYPKEDLKFRRAPQDVFEPNPLKRRLERRPPSKEFDEIMKKIEKEEREKAMAKRDYKRIIIQMAMKKKALQDPDALFDNPYDIAEQELAQEYPEDFEPDMENDPSEKRDYELNHEVGGLDRSHGGRTNRNKIRDEMADAMVQHGLIQGEHEINKMLLDGDDMDQYVAWKSRGFESPLPEFLNPETFDINNYQSGIAEAATKNRMKSTYLANQDLMKRLMTVSQVEADPEDDMMYDPDERAWRERESNPGMSDEYKPSWEPKKKIRPHKKQFGVNNESPNRPR